MARTQRIQQRRSGTGNAVPGNGTLHTGELAVNYTDNLWWYGNASGDPTRLPFISTNLDTVIEPGVKVTWSSDHINPTYASYDTVIPYAVGIDFAATIISWHTLGGWGLENLDGALSGNIVAGLGRPIGVYSGIQFDKTASTTAIVTLGTGHGLVAGDKIGISESSDVVQLPIYTVYEVLVSPAPTATTVAINTGVSGTVAAGTCNVVTNETWMQFSTSGCQLTLDYAGLSIDSNVEILSGNSIFDESGNNRLTAPFIPCTAVNGETIVQDVLDDHESRIDAVEAKTADGDHGDISISTNTYTIDNDVVTFAKMQNINTDTLIGRSAAGSGDAAEIACNAVGRSNLAPTVRTITTDAQTVAVGDGTIIMNPGANVTLNLPAVDSTIIGKIITIKNISIYTITVDGDSADTIDGAATYPIVSQYESVTLLAAATNTWYIL